MFNSHWSVSVVLVHKSLESVQIPPVIGDEGASISSWLIHLWHFLPLMVENIKLLAVGNHLILIVTASHNVNEPVFEVIMSGKTRPPH